ncbi:MAG: hypothetical protein AAF226_00710 [Verrucomicrobiota bacterium]
MSSAQFSLVPPPPELFRQFETGEISREELQSSMACHARGLISEMEEARKNPLSAYFERIRNLHAVKRLVSKCSAAELREIFTAMGRIPHFPPAQILWNANHGDMPLHCFVRMKHEPVFRIPKLEVEPMRATLYIEYGAHDKSQSTKERIILQRNALLEWELNTRESR